MIKPLLALLALSILTACEPPGAIVIDDWAGEPTPCEGDYCTAACEVRCSYMRQEHREICGRAVSICADRIGADVDRCIAERTVCVEDSTPMYDDCLSGCLAGFGAVWPN